MFLWTPTVRVWLVKVPAAALPIEADRPASNNIRNVALFIGLPNLQECWSPVIGRAYVELIAQTPRGRHLPPGAEYRALAIQAREAHTGCHDLVSSKLLFVQRGIVARIGVTPVEHHAEGTVPRHEF